jgi:RNA polymerase sigma-B factor
VHNSSIATSSTGTTTAEPRQLHEPLSAARERRQLETTELWERIASSQSEEERARLREEVVLLNMSVAQAIAGRYGSRGILLDDLQQVAYLGLVKAANGFDPDLEKDFLSYAVPTIRGEIKRHFRDLGWTVRPPRRVQELQAKINSASEDSAQVLGRAPRPPEIAEHLGVDVSDVIEALTCNGFSPTSLDAPLGDPGSSASLGGLLTTDGNDYVELENSMVLKEALRSLPARDLLILRRRFFDDHTQQEIGVELGLSQMQVSRLQARILARLRALVAPPDTDLNMSA